MTLRVPASLLCPLLLLAPAFAGAACTAITAVPATLSSNGRYCLTQDVSMGGTSGAAITIDADAVALDLQGHTVRGSGAANVSTVGINVAGHKYFDIGNGSIAGFSRGVAVVADGATRSRAGAVHDLDVHRSFLYGLLIDCDGCSVRDNAVTDTSLPAGFPGYTVDGIAVEGTGDQVTGNRVYSTRNASGETIAFAVGAANSTIARNGAFDTHGASDNAYGYLISGVSSLLVDNTAQGFSTCYWVQGAAMKYRGNLANACATSYGGGASGSGDLGGNQ